jgi:hypothetical protein
MAHADAGLSNQYEWQWRYKGIHILNAAALQVLVRSGE